MRFIIVSAAFLFFGCEVSIDSFCAAQLRAGCERGQRCGVVSRAIDCSKRGSETDCLSRYRSGLRTHVFTYDAEEAYRCVEATRGRSCGDFTVPPACVDMLAGSAQEGEQCGGCAKELRCQREGSPCGTCRSLPERPQVVGVGQACVPPGVRGAICAEGLGCVGQVCVALPPLGASCIGGLCQLGLQCSPVDDKCVHRRDVGEECTLQTGCLGGLRCIDGRCAVIAENGGGCRGGAECQSDVCVDGTCQPRRARGEPCAETLYCGELLECVAGVCVPLPLVGEACPRYSCAAPGECVSGSCRDPVVECR